MSDEMCTGCAALAAGIEVPVRTPSTKPLSARAARTPTTSPLNGASAAALPTPWTPSTAWR